MRKSLISPRTVGFGIHMTTSLIAKLTSADENEHDWENSLENHEIDETNTEQIIVPGSYEAKNVDDPKNGAKALEKDLTIPDREILYEFQDDIIVNDPVISHGLDNIRRGKDHEEACGQQRSDGFINTNDILIQSKYMIAKITETKEEPIAGTTQTHWDVVEVWEAQAHTDDADPNILVELGTDVLMDDWLGMNAIDEETETEIFWDAKSCQEDEDIGCQTKKKNSFGIALRTQMVILTHK